LAELTNAAASKVKHSALKQRQNDGKKRKQSRERRYSTEDPTSSKPVLARAKGYTD
jgi:hypothetical protein